MNKVIDIISRYSAISPEAMDVLNTRFAYEVFRRAVTTKSANENENMEMLEFIGDSVVNCVTLAEILRRKPELLTVNTGIVYKLMNNVTSKAPLARISNECGVARLIVSNTNIDDSAKEDAMEAFIGAYALLAQLSDGNLLTDVERFVVGVIDRQLTDVMAEAEAKKFDIAMYMQDSDIATTVLNRRIPEFAHVDHSMVDNYDKAARAHWSIVVSNDRGKKTVTLVGPRRPNKQAARAALYKEIIKNPHLFNSAYHPVLGGASPIGKTRARPVKSQEVLEHVLNIFELPKPSTPQRTAELLNMAFTDSSVSLDYANNSMLNMFGDRIVKLYMALVYIPKRYPFMLNEHAVNDVSHAISRISTSRATFLRRFDMARFLEIGDALFAESDSKAYHNAMSTAFTAMLCAISWNSAEKMGQFLLPTAALMDRVLGTALETVDMDSFNPAFSSGGRASYVMQGLLPKRASEVYKPNGEGLLMTKLENAGVRGFGTTKAEALDDAADEAISLIVGHPYRSSLGTAGYSPAMTAQSLLAYLP